MYYIYGHYLDGKCIYIGSNHHRGSENRAYDFSDRNKKYAEVTKNRKDEIEVRNNAESLVYNSQKTIDELGDKISGEEKAKVETEIENVKKALEGSNVEEIKTATEKLTTAFYAVSEKLYSQAADANKTAGAQSDGEPKVDENGNVYDADYKVENDDNGDNK